MKKWMKGLLSATVLSLSVAQAVAGETVVRLATTTSTYNSGLLDVLLPVFEQKHQTRIHVIAVGTGKALRMGRAGDVDLVMTHAPGAEKKFVDEGFGINARSLMYNDFVLVGPAQDPAGLKSANSVADAMARIASGNAVFVSRGDDSGTHKKETGLWHKASVTPTFSSYREVGQGMGKVLQIADELNGYTLTDRGTWLAYEDRLQLKLVFEGDKALFNPYQVILVNPELHKGLNTLGAENLQRWLISEEGQKLIGDFRIKGKALFHASAS
ncbi:substrate-binding domain-containing protein [Marinobacterium jannaschii]|uniref:substrate-binding domain-containing protein n=1 Tax=Marinobacterium jannaschii TaxID=64970 RepID=UPI000AEFD181|nr:substrate-binding domain-containing protein [Marinobacterium jannaschii]